MFTIYIEDTETGKVIYQKECEESQKEEILELMNGIAGILMTGDVKVGNKVT